MVIYRIEPEIVDPIFFAVVPDSFMFRQGQDGADWTDEQDRPVISPNDRWSF